MRTDISKELAKALTHGNWRVLGVIAILPATFAAIIRAEVHPPNLVGYVGFWIGIWMIAVGFVRIHFAEREMQSRAGSFTPQPRFGQALIPAGFVLVLISWLILVDGPAQVF